MASGKWRKGWSRVDGRCVFCGSMVGAHWELFWPIGRDPDDPIKLTDSARWCTRGHLQPYGKQGK